jgi:hypothetical protein
LSYKSTNPMNAPARLTTIQWLICAVAALRLRVRFLHSLMLPIIIRPALADLLGVAPNPSLAVNDWVGTLQCVPAVRRRNFRTPRRLSDGPSGTPARARVEHPALCRIHGVCRHGYVSSGAALLAVLRLWASAWSLSLRSHGSRELFSDPKQRERSHRLRRRSGRSAA